MCYENYGKQYRQTLCRKTIYFKRTLMFKIENLEKILTTNVSTIIWSLVRVTWK